MYKDDEEQRRVWQLLESVAVTNFSDSWFERAVGLAKGIKHLDLLASLAARHKMMPALARFYRSARLASDLPAGMRDTLAASLARNQYEVGKLRDESIDIAGRFAELGISVAFNKGVVLQYNLYDGCGIRSFNDIDIMVHPDGASAARKALQSLGYVPEQQYDPDLGQLVQLPRRTALMYRLYPDHLPHFHRIDPESGIPVFIVDVALSLTWHGSAWQFPMDEVMGSAREARVGPQDRHVLPTLGDGYAFLFVMLHLFRNCWFERAIAEGELRLSQFADVWRYWQRWGRKHAEQVRTLVGENGLEPAVAWVAYYVDALYGSTMTADLGLRSFCAPEWLRSVAGTDGGYRSWDGDMHGRLFGRASVALKPAGEPPYGALARGRFS
ncbi:nucleotidyltransferase family protein [Micromonospora sp. NPDC051196]|uniref:nucleotidyltransferase family protein n=1 Tax=Micromonospora sp. NPDC051196 TaxID=3155281 RepID=UPI0034434034